MLIKKTHLNKKFILSLFLFLFLFTFTKDAIGVVPCGLGASDPCTLCHLIVGGINILNWGMKILVALSLAGITVAGVMYMISTGDPALTKRAKDFITSVIIGFSLMLGAWLIINTTFYLLSAKKNSAGEYTLGLTSKNWYTFSCSVISSSTGTGSSASITPPITPLPVGPPLSSYDCDKLAFQSGVKNQCTDDDASTALKLLILCMRNKLGPSMTITSISDNAGLSFCANSHRRPPCAHAKNSCHYGGGRGGVLKSEAVDISTSTGLTTSAIIAATYTCSAGYRKYEGDHVHVSTSVCPRN